MSVCPREDCTGRLIYWGRYWRWVALSEQERERIPVVRKRCVACHRTCSFLPPFLVRRRPWVMDCLVGSIRALATTGTRVADAWSRAPEMSLRAFGELARMAAGWAARAGSGVRAWTGAVEPAFDPEALSVSEVVAGSRWPALARVLLTLEALGQWRARMGRGPISAMGLLQLCATHHWADLLAAGG